MAFTEFCWSTPAQRTHAKLTAQQAALVTGQITYVVPAPTYEAYSYAHTAQHLLITARGNEGSIVFSIGGNLCEDDNS